MAGNVEKEEEDTAADCRLGLTYRTEDLAWPGRQKKKRLVQAVLAASWFLHAQTHASVSQGRICSHHSTCCHTEIEVTDPTCYPIQSQYIDTGPASPSADSITPGAWQGSHWSADFEVTGMTRPGKIPAQSGIEPRVCRSRGGRLNLLANETVLEREREGGGGWGKRGGAGRESERQTDRQTDRQTETERDRETESSSKFVDTHVS